MKPPSRVQARGSHSLSPGGQRAGISQHAERRAVVAKQRTSSSSLGLCPPPPRMFHPSCFERDRTPRADNTRPITCMALGPAVRLSSSSSPSSRSSSLDVLVGSADHAAYVFDATTGAGRRRLYSRSRGHVDWVSCCAFLADGRPVTGGMDGKLCLWGRSRSGGSETECVDLMGEQGSVSAVAEVGKHGEEQQGGGRRRVVVSSGYDGSLCVWNVNAAAERGGRISHEKLINPKKALPPITGFACSKNDDGHLVLSCSRNGMLSLWDCGRGMKILKAVFGKHRGRVSGVLAIDGANSCLFATGGLDGLLALWDPRSVRGGGPKEGGAARRPAGAALALSSAPHTHETGRGVSSGLCPCAPITALAELPSSAMTTGCAPVSHLVSGGGDGALLLLEPRRNLEPIVKFLGRDTDRGDDNACSPVTSVCVSLRGGEGLNAPLIASGRGNGLILAHEPRGEQQRPVRSFEVQPGSAKFLAATDSALIASGDSGSASIFWL